MSELIVLGLIPGTQIRITFVLWFIVVLASVIAYLVRFGRRTNLFRNWVVTMYLLIVMRRTVIQR